MDNHREAHEYPHMGIMSNITQHEPILWVAVCKHYCKNIEN